MKIPSYVFLTVSSLQIQGPIFIGPACECDRDGCPSFNGELCSGRGECTCTGCRCNVEPNTQMLYSGTACECTPDTDCVDPTNSTVRTHSCIKHSVYAYTAVKKNASMYLVNFTIVYSVLLPYSSITYSMHIFR